MTHIRNRLVLAFAIGLLASLLSSPFATAQPPFSIAVFGDNQIDDYLNSAGFSATLVTDADLSTAGFLDAYDAFFYTRDGVSTPGTSLSAGAVANVQAFVGSSGRGVLLNGDFADTLLGATPDTEIQQLISNATAWAATTQHGFIGEYTGAVAGLTTNSDTLTPLGFVSGNAGLLGNGPAEGAIVKTAEGESSPVLAGVDFTTTDPTDELSFGSIVTGVDSSLVLATYSNPGQPNDGNPAIINFSFGADLEITKSRTTPLTTPVGTIYATEDVSDPRNVVTFTITLVNHGPSTAEDVTITDMLDATQLENATFCQVPDEASTCTPTDPFTGTIGGEGTSLEPGTYTYLIKAHARDELGHGEEPTGRLTNVNTASVESATPPAGENTDDRTSDPVSTFIDTVPGGPVINLATAGNAKAGLNWSAPASGGRPLTKYTVYAAPCPTANPSPCPVLQNVSTVPNAAPVVGGQFTTFSYFVTGLQNNTTYTFTVTATNDVGEGDPSDGAPATPNVSADTNKIGANGQGTVDTGLAAGALGCAPGIPASDPRCRNVVGQYTITDPKDVGSLIALGALGDTPAARVIPCLEAELALFGTNSTTGVIVSDGDCIADKYVLSQYPTTAETLRVPHLEMTKYDASATTTPLGSPCFALILNADGTPKLFGGEPRCSNPNYANYPGLTTNMCPEGVGWTKSRPCAYIYYSVVEIPGYNVSNLGNPGVNRPTKCGPSAPPACDDAAIIGSTVSAGIRVNTGSGIVVLVRPWCQGKFPYTNAPAPCVFKMQWLNNSTGNGNNDQQWQEYAVADPGGRKTG